MASETLTDMFRALHEFVREHDRMQISPVKDHPAWPRFRKDVEDLHLSGIRVTVGDGVYHVDAGGHADPLDTFDRSAAGGTLPRVVLRDGGHRPVPVWERERAGGIAAAADQRNRLTYARIEALKHVYGFLALTGKAANEEQRHAAEADLHDAVKAYPESLEAAMDAYDTAAGPTDLEVARAALIESLDGIASRRSQELRWDAQKRRAGPGAACVNLDRALREVAGIRNNAETAISGGGTLEDIEDAYARGIRTIGEIRALNVPLWTVGDQVIDDSRPSPRTVHGRLTFIRARQPDDGVPGSVEVTLEDLRGLVEAGGRPRLRKDGTDAVIAVSVPPEVTAPITVTITARNACGENDITITFDPDPAPA